MKNVIKISLLAVALFVSTQGNAQSKVKKAEHAVGRDAKVVGHKTAHIASKGAAAVVDRPYKGKYGPGHETVYIDKHSRYYYVNKLGHHVYVTRAELHNR